MNRVDEEAIDHLRRNHDVDVCTECAVAVQTLISALIVKGHGNEIASYVQSRMAILDDDE